MPIVSEAYARTEEIAMPKAMERKLMMEVAGKPWSKKRKDAYIYGTMRKMGWVPSTQKRRKKKK